MTTISSLTTQWINLCPHPVNDYNFVINNTTDKPNFVFKLLQVQLDVFQKCFFVQELNTFIVCHQGSNKCIFVGEHVDGVGDDEQQCVRGVLNNMVVEKHVAENQNDLGGNGGERVEQDGS